MKLTLTQLTRYVVYLYILVVVATDSIGSLAAKIVRVLVVGVLLLYFLKKPTLKKSFYVFWAVGFLLYNTVLAQYAYSVSVARSYTQSLLYTVAVDVLVCLFLMREGGVEEAWRAYIAGAVLKAGKLFALNGPLVFLNARSVDNISANTIGIHCAIAAVLCVLFYLDCRRTPGRQNRRYLYGVLALLNSAFMVLSASRKAFLFLGIPLMVVGVLCSRNQRRLLRNIVLGAMGVAVVVLCLWKIPFLYELVGRRFETMISGFLGGETDNSTSTRLKLISAGLLWFRERWAFGYGMLNYKAMNIAIRGSEYYAHNNYIELLVDCGLVGTLWYYALYMRILRSGIRQYRRERSLSVAMVLGLMVSVIVCEYGLVTYYLPEYQLLMMLAYVLVWRKEKLYRLSHLTGGKPAIAGKG